MLWDLHQEMSIRRVRAEQGAAEEAQVARTGSVRDEVWRLEDRLERLLLLTDALWELASERLGVTDADLAAKVREIDARSGAIDGHRPRLVRRCGACDAAVEHGRATCTFCGAEVPGAGPVDAV
jgi:hypothetical protein